MNIVERLMQIDDNAVNTKHTEIYKSHRLARILGESEPVDIEIKELPYRKVSDIMTSMTDKKGQVQMDRKVDTELLLVLEAVTNIDFRDKALMDKFNCATPKDLAEKLLQNDVPLIAEKVAAMSGFSAEDENKESEDIEEIKNS